MLACYQSSFIEVSRKLRVGTNNHAFVGFRICYFAMKCLPCLVSVLFSATAYCSRASSTFLQAQDLYGPQPGEYDAHIVLIPAPLGSERYSESDSYSWDNNGDDALRKLVFKLENIGRFSPFHEDFAYSSTSKTTSDNSKSHGLPISNLLDAQRGYSLNPISATIDSLARFKTSPELIDGEERFYIEPLHLPLEPSRALPPSYARYPPSRWRFPGLQYYNDHNFHQLSQKPIDMNGENRLHVNEADHLKYIQSLAPATLFPIPQMATYMSAYWDGFAEPLHKRGLLDPLWRCFGDNRGQSTVQDPPSPKRPETPPDRPIPSDAPRSRSPIKRPESPQRNPHSPPPPPAHLVSSPKYGIPHRYESQLTSTNPSDTSTNIFEITQSTCNKFPNSLNSKGLSDSRKTKSDAPDQGGEGIMYVSANRKSHRDERSARDSHGTRNSKSSRKASESRKSTVDDARNFPGVSDECFQSSWKPPWGPSRGSSKG